MKKKTTFFRTAIITTLIISSANIYASRIEKLNPPANGSYVANDISSDGNTIAGSLILQNTSSGQANQPAAIWQQTQGIISIGTLGGSYGSAISVSANGQVVVGTSRVNNNSGSRNTAFKWTTSGMVNIGGNTYESYAQGTNATGDIVVGLVFDGQNQDAFRWTSATGIQPLGDFAGGAYRSEALAISKDGNVIVGYGTTANNTQAFRWTQTNGMVSLENLSNYSGSVAYNTNNDGTVIVGLAKNGQTEQAFRWVQTQGTNTGVMTGLGFLPGGYFESKALAVSADGSVVVGKSKTGNGIVEAFIWTQTWRMQNLKSVLILQGVDMSNWGTLERASGVTILPDGNIVVTGLTMDGTAFRAEIGDTICHMP